MFTWITDEEYTYTLGLSQGLEFFFLFRVSLLFSKKAKVKIINKAAS